MRKPMELTVYPPLEYPHKADPITMGRYIRQRNGELIMRNIKRLTDAELAAEYWAPNWITMPNADWDNDYEACVERMKDRSSTLHRFATLPHYDETQP
jgi:hypothetical protein